MVRSGVVAMLLAAAVLVGCGGGGGEGAVAPSGGAVALPALDEAARNKLDARLLQLYRAFTVSPPNLEAAAVLAGLIELTEQDGGLQVSVLAQTDATDAALNGTGLRITARAGRIVSGTIAVAALPALAALDEVQWAEAARRLRLT